MPDAHVANWEAAVVTPPSPAVSGTSLTVTAGAGALLPTLPYNLIVCPAGADPSALGTPNFETIRVTARTTDSLDTIARAQEGSTARTILAGDRILAAPTVKTFTDIEGAGWTQQVFAGGLNPADATTYFCGTLITSVAWTTTEASGRGFVVQTGTLIRMIVHLFNNGTNGTSETSTMYFRLNNTTDTTGVTTVATDSGSAFRALDSGAISGAVTVGDYFNNKWITPTWATNPTSLQVSVLNFFRR